MVPGYSADSAQKTMQNRLFEKKHDAIKELSIHDQNSVRLPRQNLKVMQKTMKYQAFLAAG